MTLTTTESKALLTLLSSQKVEALEHYGLLDLAQKLRSKADSPTCANCGYKTDNVWNRDYCYSCHTKHNLK